MCSVENTNAHQLQASQKEHLSDFDAWASILEQEFSYKSLKENIPTGADYIILAKVNTHPVSFEAFVVYQHEGANFKFLSSNPKKVVSCVNKKSTFDTNIVRYDLLSTFDVSVEFEDVHPFYTVIEKRESGAKILFTFDNLSNRQLEKEVIKLENYLSSRMLIDCEKF